MVKDWHYTIIPTEVIRRAWTLPDGFHTVNHTHTDGTDFPYAVFKDKKMVIAAPRDSPTDHLHEYLHIVAFPRPEHINLFRRASRGVKDFGGTSVSEINPGAVGTITLARMPKGSPSGFIMDTPQSHFMTEGNPHLSRPELGLKRRFAEKFFGWRKRAVLSAFDFARRHDSDLAIHKLLFTPLSRPGARDGKTMHIFKKELESVYKEQGLKLTESGFYSHIKVKGTSRMVKKQAHKLHK